jgi:hypothetical protein
MLVVVQKFNPVSASIMRPSADRRVAPWQAWRDGRSPWQGQHASKLIGDLISGQPLLTFEQTKRCNGVVIDCCVDVRGGFLGDGSPGFPPAPPKGPLGPGGALRFPGAGAGGRIFHLKRLD